MTARISLIPGKTRGHRPRLQVRKPREITAAAKPLVNLKIDSSIEQKAAHSAIASDIGAGS